MALNPGGNTSYNWNHTNESRDGFSLEMTGTVVSIQEVQARDWDQQTRRPAGPKTWPNGDPVWNIRMGFAQPDGSLKTFTFAEAGKKQRAGEKPSVHMTMYNLFGSMEDLMGKTLHIKTWSSNPTTGQAWGFGNPRLYEVEVVDDVVYELKVPLPNDLVIPRLYADDGAHGGQPVAQAPQQIHVPQVPPMQGQFYAPPVATPTYPAYQQPMPQPAYQQPMPQPMSAIQAMPPQTAPMPQGMDPAVAQAMQMTGAQNVQPVYEDIPF